MAKTTVLMSFKRMSGAELAKATKAIVNGMTGNAHFPKPVPTIAVLNAASNKFSDALAAVVTGGTPKVYLKDDAREELEDLLVTLGSYVNYTSGGDAAIAATSGYPLSKVRGGKRALGVIENFSVQPGKNADEMVASVNGVENVKSYTLLWGPTPIVNDTWKHLPCDATAVVGNLERGVQHAFKMCAHGAHGQVAYTEVITRWVG